MADMNYVSPLTSDLTDYYTKSEVDELQQGDAATYATSAEIVAGDNAVKGWVVSQGFLTEHQDLTNYATISYVDDAIAAIEPSSGGMAVRVVSTLPGVGEENVLYLVFVDNEDEDNRYAEYIWVDTLNDYEMLGFSSSEGGIIPDLTDYATKQWVEAKGYLTAIDAKDVSYDNAASGLEAANVKNAIDEVNAKVEAIDVPDVSGFLDDEDLTAIQNQMSLKADASSLSTVATTGSYNDLTNKPAIPTVPANVSAFTNDAGYLTAHQDISGKANTADLATVAFSGDYDDLANKPSIPSTSGLASESYVDAAIGNLSIPTKVSDLDNDMNFVDEAMAKAAAIDEINNNVSAAGLSGSYNDLDDKPTIPSLSGYATEQWVGQQGYLTQHQDISGKANTADLATVATTGDYDDLTNKPTIPVLPTLATVATSGSYNDLSDKPTIPTSDKITGLDLILSGLISNIGYNKAPARVNSNNDAAIWKAEFLEKLATGKWLFLNSPYGKVITASDLGVDDFYLIEYDYDNDTLTRKQGSNNVGITLYTIPGDSQSYSGYFARTGINTFFYVYSTSNTLMKNNWLLKLLESRLTYSNTTSGLTATTIQGAIDELAASSGGASTAAQLSYDNTNTWNDGTDTDTVQEAIDSLYADVENMASISYELSETYDATNKTLTLSVVESSGL